MKYKFDFSEKFAKAQFSFKIYFAALRLECLLFCSFAIGMPVILQLCDWNACYFAVRFSFQIDFREGAID
ncbi:MAG: hypothetical protein DRR16_28365 [Candidatus Parabeggiatoa sp. nov. 3]|nr:MAG: hypothetical protein DRR00_22600 [Gammaproteobacteria bacterium]RKZ57006.1 MAG: hypothetical protein DRQ99_27655 [Gammaproteobacteria bacterium]RKZ78102.1 MAG: hypothetical protein DRR16_28365 [Gammaproteobacteria bacterium]